MTDGDWLW